MSDEISKLNNQRKALKEYILLSKKNEEDRLIRLEKESNNKIIKYIEKRFEMERLNEQTIICRLMEEYNSLKVILDSKIKQLVDSQSDSNIDENTKNNGINKKKPKEIYTMKLDRFQGFVVDPDVEFLKQVYKRFDGHDTKFDKQLNKHTFNSYEETKKLELLKERKNVIQKMIKVQSQELKAVAEDAIIFPTINKYNNNNNTISSITEGSYATFTSNNNSYKPFVKPKFIPELKLNK